MASSGQLASTNMIWKEGMAGWMKAEQVGLTGFEPATSWSRSIPSRKHRFWQSGSFHIKV
ncbi:MAG: DUF4339 domain-containing protein [Gemmataceae bacterium]|nr:DUF4339 domain-containing protein [Gemmataceae bacterium]